MAAIVYNLYMYLLYILMYSNGKKASFIERNDNKRYWKALYLPIILFAIMEGTRWNRGADYLNYYKIANGLDESGDFVFDAFANLLHSINMPYQVFFIIISGLLIYSIYKYAKEFKEALFPISILMIASMAGPAENLMRQFAAISLEILALSAFYNKSYKWTVLFLVMGYFTHSSFLFFIPFIFIALILYYIPFINKSIFVKRLDWIFIALYLSATILSTYFSDLLQEILSYSNLGFANRYLEYDYILNATSTDLINKVDVIGERSIIFISREYLRAIVVIYLGYKIYKKEPLSEKKRLIYFVTWVLACFGIIYKESVPELKMEVIGRLNLYLIYFMYFIEGYIIYYYLLRTDFKNRKIGYERLIVSALVLLEVIWIAKWQDGGSTGLSFTWLY